MIEFHDLEDKEDLERGTNNIPYDFLLQQIPHP